MFSSINFTFSSCVEDIINDQYVFFHGKKLLFNEFLIERVEWRPNGKRKETIHNLDRGRKRWEFHFLSWVKAHIMLLLLFILFKSVDWIKVYELL